MNGIQAAGKKKEREIRNVLKRALLESLFVPDNDAFSRFSISQLGGAVYSIQFKTNYKKYEMCILWYKILQQTLN